MRWLHRKRDDDEIDPTEAIETAEAAKRLLTQNQPFVTRVSNYFENRQGQNGFGDDIEFTFRPKAQGNQ